MYCATCWADASYCPPQPDGSYLCPGCAGIQGDAPVTAPEPTPAPRSDYCAECGYFADGSPRKRDGASLCVGCASCEPSTPTEPVAGGYIRYTDGTVETCHHYNGRHLDGSCVDCGYC